MHRREAGMLVKTILVGKGPVHPVNAAPWFELVTGWLRKNDFFVGWL